MREMQPRTERWRTDPSPGPEPRTGEPAIPTDGRRTTPEAPTPQPPPQPRARAWRQWLVRLGILLVVLGAVAVVRWWTLRPQDVTLIQPTLTTITETIASSGRVR